MGAFSPPPSFADFQIRVRAVGESSAQLFTSATFEGIEICLPFLPGTAYELRVRTKIANGDVSGYTSWQQFQTTAVSNVPSSEPTFIAFDGETLDVSWGSTSGDCDIVDKYQLRVRPSGASSSTLVYTGGDQTFNLANYLANRPSGTVRKKIEEYI